MTAKADGPAQEILVGIDVGTTNVKCGIYRADGRSIGAGTTPTRAAARLWDTPFGRFEAGDAAALWPLVGAVCREAAQTLGAPERSAIRGIAVSGVGCTAVCVDAGDRPLYPLQFGDTAPALFETYQREMGPDRYQATTGYPLEPDNTAFQLARLRELDPHGYRQIAAVLSVSDYVNLRLTGLRAREPSTAASMALWNQADNTWWQEFLDALQLGPEVLGSPVPSGRLLGPLTAAAAMETGWPEGTPVYLGGHDYLCAALAAGCTTPATLLNISGTFDIVAAFQDTPDVRRTEQRTIVDHHVVPGMYSVMAEAVGGGQAEWLRRQLLGAGSGGGTAGWERLLDELGALPPPFTATREAFVPHLFGRWSPSREDASYGSYVGLSGDSTGASLLRATIVGTCFQSRQILDGLRQIVPQTTGPLRMVGGGRHPAWMQIKADALGLTLAAPRIHEASALGAALLAGIGAGVYRGFEEASRVSAAFGADIYEPAAGARAAYDQAYRTVYPFLLDAMRHVDERLSRLGEPG